MRLAIRRDSPLLQVCPIDWDLDGHMWSVVDLCGGWSLAGHYRTGGGVR